MDKLFSHTYIINMEKRADKRCLMEFKLDRIGLTNYSFFNGIDGESTSLDSVYDNLHNKQLFTSRGALGLVMTYIEILKDIYAKGYQEVLILEDDVNIHKSHKKLVKMF